MGFSQFQKTNKNWAFCFDPNNKPIILFFSHKNPNFVLQISLCSALYLQKKIKIKIHSSPLVDAFAEAEPPWLPPRKL